jgi:electron transport complex protein RnfB
MQVLAEIKLKNLAAHSRITDPEVLKQKKAVIEAAMARARAKRHANPD